MPAPNFLTSLHPVYQEQKENWRTLERRLRGAQQIIDAELYRFAWETKDGDHFAARKAQATYLNFPELHTRSVVGHLLREAPEVDDALDFGTLGEANRAEGQTTPSQAELVYFNADGIGNDASQWNGFWSRAMTWAGATGHRWIMVDAAAGESARNRADEMAGRRPFLVHLSPLAVPDWHVQDGKLAYAFVTTRERRPGRAEGRFVGASEKVTLVLVRRGWEEFGPEYAAGGWWRYGQAGELLGSGDWRRTNGEIPLFPIYWERDDQSDEDHPTISRSGTHALGQIAVSHMNLTSAADFDAWDAGGSLQWLRGVDRDGFNLAMQLMKDGNRWLPLQAAADGVIPDVTDGSGGAVTADVFNLRIKQKMEEARSVSLTEASGRPDSSGESKRSGFLDTKAPLLARIAEEMETAQNTAIHFLELRFGHERPRGSVRWPREFDLEPLVSEIESMFDLEDLSGYRSPTLGAKAMTSAARARGLITDDSEATTIEAEYRNAANVGRTQEAQEGTQEEEIEDILAGTAAAGNGAGA